MGEVFNPTNIYSKNRLRHETPDAARGAHRQYMHRLETRAKRIERIGDHSDQKLPIAGA